MRQVSRRSDLAPSLGQVNRCLDENTREVRLAEVHAKSGFRQVQSSTFPIIPFSRNYRGITCPRSRLHGQVSDLRLSMRHWRFAMEATPGASATSKEYDFLLSILLVIRLSAYSGDRSCELSRSSKKDRVVKGIGQHWHYPLVQRKSPGSILETAGSSSDLEGQSAV
ncbi:hypothetical protein HDF13_003203 [Edaphobacter lichenicola]|uniref:Uncharacterized protein n=1 Tax=Tunturiibacter gelidiferens TaxID=3069689 RepID=A0ACC5P256_9BACT|nr:hypothetical protein [Edaphobacter lichenicola]